VGRAASTLALAAGFCVLAAGVAIAVVRHDRSVDARGRDAALQAARFDGELRRVGNQVPRFGVSYVEIPLAEARRLIRTRFTVVGTEVARRLTTGRPSLHPDFAALAGTSDDVLSRTFKAGLFTPNGVIVIGLLVTQITPGPATLRLTLARLRVRTYFSVWDPLDVLPGGPNSIYRTPRLGLSSKTVVRWRPRLGATAFVPLSVFNAFLLPRTPANSSLISELGGDSGALVTSDVVLGPTGLFVHRPHGRDVEIDLSATALHPLRLHAGTRR
jgi:hypothetical protein